MTREEPSHAISWTPPREPATSEEQNHTHTHTHTHTQQQGHQSHRKQQRGKVMCETTQVLRRDTNPAKTGVRTRASLWLVPHVKVLCQRFECSHVPQLGGVLRICGCFVPAHTNTHDQHNASACESASTLGGHVPTNSEARPTKRPQYARDTHTNEGGRYVPHHGDAGLYAFKLTDAADMDTVGHIRAETSQVLALDRRTQLLCRLVVPTTTTTTTTIIITTPSPPPAPRTNQSPPGHAARPNHTQHQEAEHVNNTRQERFDTATLLVSTHLLSSPRERGVTVVVNGSEVPVH